MKMVIVLWLLFSSSAFALQVLSSVYNSRVDVLELQVQYTGSDNFEHRFEMHLSNCALSRTENIGTVNVCDGQVIDLTGPVDRGQSVIKRQLNVSLASLSSDVRPIVIGFESGIVLIPKKGY